MKIGLVSYRSENKNIPFNLTQIERALKETQGQAELLCFGEAFLQGFDSLCWDYETDRQMAVDQNSETMDYLRGLTVRYGTGLLSAILKKKGIRFIPPAPYWRRERPCIITGGSPGDGKNTGRQMNIIAKGRKPGNSYFTEKRSCRPSAGICGIIRKGSGRSIC